MVRILYFAWVRERIGTGEERVAVPENVTSLEELAHWLQDRSEGHRSALSDRTRLRAAVDQSFAGWGTPIAGAAEIAFFPPVTGG